MIQHLAIYPIKSCAGIELTELEITDIGPRYDRHWMIVDEEGLFLTQRKFPKMALIKTDLIMNDVLASDLKITCDRDSTLLPIDSESHELIQATVWNDTVRAKVEETNPGKVSIHEMLSDFLAHKVKLVRCVETRRVDTKYVPENIHTQFSDGFPLLMIGTESLKDLSAKMGVEIPWQRFRPNIVLKTSNPYEEDKLGEFLLSGIKLRASKSCSRCPIIDVDHTAGEVSEHKPLKALAKYRLEGKKILFGQNLIHLSQGVLKVGDIVSSSIQS